MTNALKRRTIVIIELVFLNILMGVGFWSEHPVAALMGSLIAASLLFVIWTWAESPKTLPLDYPRQRKNWLRAFWLFAVVGGLSLGILFVSILTDESLARVAVVVCLASMGVMGIIGSRLDHWKSIKPFSGSETGGPVPC